MTAYAQAQLQVSEEIFQQRLFNMSLAGQQEEPRRADPFRYKLRFDHLLMPVSHRTGLQIVVDGSGATSIEPLCMC